MKFMNEQQVREHYTNKLKSWIGKSEYNGGHRSIVDIYNSNRPLPRGYKVTYYDAWCATTMGAAAIATGLQSIIPIECSCHQMVLIAKRMGIWVENDGYVPKIGDIIMYDWQDNGIGDNVGTPDHVGAVIDVQGNIITIVEGNMDNAVGTRTIQVNARFIRGYITPKYASMISKEVPDGEADYRAETQKRFGFDNNTMLFLDNHPFKDALYEKLATKK